MCSLKDFSFCNILFLSIKCQIRSYYLMFLGITGKIDVVYAVDGSRRVDASMYEQMKNFLKSSLRSFNITESGAHIAVAQYGSRAEIKVNLNDGTNLARLDYIVGQLSRIGGPRRMNKALRLVNSDIYGKQDQSRVDAKRLLVLLTTGKNSGDGSGELPRVARELRDQGVEIVVVVIGKESDPSEILAITGKGGNTVKVSDAGNLDAAVGALEGTIKDAGGIKIVFTTAAENEKVVLFLNRRPRFNVKI